MGDNVLACFCHQLAYLPASTDVPLIPSEKHHHVCSQAPQNAELVEPAGALAAIEALYSFLWSGKKSSTGDSSGTGGTSASVLDRAQQNCIPARYKVDPDFRKTYLVIQVRACLPLDSFLVYIRSFLVEKPAEWRRSPHGCFLLSTADHLQDIEFHCWARGQKAFR